MTPQATHALTMALHLHDVDRETWGTRLRQIAAELGPALLVMNVTPMDKLLRQQQRSMRLLAGVSRP